MNIWVLTKQQEFELTAGVPLVTPQLSLDLLVNALLFLGLFGQATRHCSGNSRSTLRPGPPRRRRTVGCCGAPVITWCAAQPPFSPPPPPTRPAAADASCHSTVTSAPCLTKNSLCCVSTSTTTTTTTVAVGHPTTATTTGGTPSSMYTHLCWCCCCCCLLPSSEEERGARVEHTSGGKSQTGRGHVVAAVTTKHEPRTTPVAQESAKAERTHTERTHCIDDETVHEKNYTHAHTYNGWEKKTPFNRIRFSPYSIINFLF